MDQAQLNHWDSFCTFCKPLGQNRLLSSSTFVKDRMPSPCLLQVLAFGPYLANYRVLAGVTSCGAKDSLDQEPGGGDFMWCNGFT